MSSIRLRPDQINRLKKCHNASSVVWTAYKRFKKGHFDLKEAEEIESEETLEVFSIHKKPPLSCKILRKIIDLHFSHPVDYSKKIQELDVQISKMIENLPKVVFD